MASLLTIYVRPQNGSAPVPDLCETLHRYCTMPLALFFGRKIAVGTELREIPVADRINTLGLALIAFFLLQTTLYPFTLLFATVVVLSTTGYMLNLFSISRHTLSQLPMTTPAKKEPSKKEKPAPTKLSMGRFLMRADDKTRLSTLSELLPAEEYRQALAEVLHEQPQYLPYIIHLCKEHKVDEIVLAACTDKAHFMKILEAFKDHKTGQVFLGRAFSQALNSKKINIIPFFEFLDEVDTPKLFEIFLFKNIKSYHPLLTIYLHSRFAPKTIKVLSSETTEVLNMINIVSGPRTILGGERSKLYDSIDACKGRDQLAKVFAFIDDDAEKIALFFHFAFLKEELRGPAKELFTEFIKPLKNDKLEEIFPAEVFMLMNSSFIRDCWPLFIKS